MSEIRTSIIMPTCDQASRLELTLASLTRLDPDRRDWEAIVVDDGSTDRTPEVLDHFRSRLPLRTVRQENAGRAVARNAGAASARGGTLVFCDGDRICAPGLLAAHANAADGHPDRINVGEIREVYVSNLEERRAGIEADIAAGCADLARRSRRPHFVAEVFRHVLDEKGVASPPAPWMCFFSGNLSVPRALFRQAGGFNERFVAWGMEHFELGYRLVRSGAEIHHLPDAVSYHVAHRRPAGFYESGIAASAALMRELHPGFPVEEFVALTLGRTTVPEFLTALAEGEDAR